MYLFFDTETTGLPRRKNASLKELDNWPRLVQIAWIECESPELIKSKRNYIIIPHEFSIPNQAVAIHGISTEKARKKGVPLRTALTEFVYALNRARIVIAHNMNFDEKVVGAELLRLKMSHSLWQKRRLCTMVESTNFCRLSGRRKHGYKYPSLAELHYAVFRQPHERPHGYHNAMDDVLVVARCFFALKDLGVINITIENESEIQDEIRNEVVDMSRSKEDSSSSSGGSECPKKQGLLAQPGNLLRRLISYFFKTQGR